MLDGVGALDELLPGLRVDGLAAGGGHGVAGAAGEPEAAGVVQSPGVTGAEPPVSEGLRVTGAVEVAGDDALPASEDLTVVGDAQGGARDGGADASGEDVVGAVPGERRGGLGEPVPLDDGHAQAAEEAGEVGRESGGAGEEVVDASAEQGSQPSAEDEVDEGLCRPFAARGASPRLQPRAAGGGDVLRPGPDVTEPHVRQALGDRGADLVQDARDDDEEGGAARGEGRQDVSGVGDVGDSHAVGEADELQAASEDVGQRQEDDRAAALADDVGECAGDVGDLADEVAVGEHGSLGPAAGAGGVDDGGEVVGPQGAAAVGQDRVVDARAGLREGTEGGVVVEAPDTGARVRETGPGQGAAQAGGLLADAAEGQGDARVGDDLVDLGLGGGVVERHDDAGGVPGGELDDGPLVAGGGHDADAPAGLQAGGDEPLGGGGGLLVELTVGHRLPGAGRVGSGGKTVEGDGVRRGPDPGLEEGEDAVVVADGDGCGDGCLGEGARGSGLRVHRVCWVVRGGTVFGVGHVTSSCVCPGGRASRQGPAWPRGARAPSLRLPVTA